MDEEEVKKCKAIERLYDQARHICDPVDYAVRHRNLMYGLSEFLLFDYYKYKMREGEDNET